MGPPSLRRKIRLQILTPIIKARAYPLTKLALSDWTDPSSSLHPPGRFKGLQTVGAKVTLAPASVVEYINVIEYIRSDPIFFFRKASSPPFFGVTP